MSGAVEVRGVSVVYGGTTVLDDVSLSVDRGSWMGVLGPNGAGKSTLLRVIAGERPTAGAVAVVGDDIGALTARRRAHRVAYLPQSPTYPRGMTVFDYVLLGRTSHMGRLAAESSGDIEFVWEAIRALDLEILIARDVATLSGGETQRLALARAIAQRAPVLVLDEATASLDVARQHQVLELIDQLRTERELAVVSAVHDLTAAGQFCDRVALLDGGRLRSIGTPSEVLTEDLLADVYEPGIRVLTIDGETVVVSMREKESST